MTLGVEYLQGDKVLREGIQIVNTVILKVQREKKRDVSSVSEYVFFS